MKYLTGLVDFLMIRLLLRLFLDFREIKGFRY